MCVWVCVGVCGCVGVCVEYVVVSTNGVCVCTRKSLYASYCKCVCLGTYVYLLYMFVSTSRS